MRDVFPMPKRRTWLAWVVAALGALVLVNLQAHADGFPFRPRFGQVTLTPGDSTSPLIFNNSRIYETAGGIWLLTNSAASGLFASNNQLQFGLGQDLTLRRQAANTLQLGQSDSASPAAQTLGVQSVVAGTSNTAGQNFNINGSASTGSARGGFIVFNVTRAGGSGTAQNPQTPAMTLDSGNVAGTSLPQITDSANFVVRGDITNVKAADTARTSNVTLTADPDLSVSFNSGGSFAVHFEVLYTVAATGATPGIQYSTTLTGTVAAQSCRSSEFNATAGTLSGESGTGALAARSVAPASATGVIAIDCTLSGITVGGTLTFNWAQVNTSASATTVKTGSYVLMHRLTSF